MTLVMGELHQMVKFTSATPWVDPLNRAPGFFFFGYILKFW